MIHTCFAYYIAEKYVINIKKFVMRSMKRDHKSANVNYEIVKHIVDDWQTLKKKSRPKNAKMA